MSAWEAYLNPEEVDEVRRLRELSERLKEDRAEVSRTLNVIRNRCWQRRRYELFRKGGAGP